MKGVRKCHNKPSKFICDGCKSHSTKCPYRNKERDLRHSRKRKRREKLWSLLEEPESRSETF